MYDYERPMIEKFIAPITDGTWNMTIYDLSNGCYNFDPKTKKFTICGELQLIELLALGIYMYGLNCPRGSMTEHNKRLEEDPSILKETFELFDNLINSARTKMHLHGLFNPQLEEIKYSESKGGRIWTMGDELEISLYTLIDLIVTLAQFCKVSPWAEMNSDFDRKYY